MDSVVSKMAQMSLKATRTVDIPKSTCAVQDNLKKARTIDLTLRAM